MVDFGEYHVDGSLNYDLGKTARRRIITENVFKISPKVFPGVSNYRREG